jgi:hypothetical protein
MKTSQFNTRAAICPAIYLNGTQVLQAKDIKYMHLDRKLNWKKSICTKRKHLELKPNKMYWLLSRNLFRQKLSLENKILLYKTILKPIWTYGIQLWGTTVNSNLEILQRYQSKILRIITNPLVRHKWYSPFVISRYQPSKKSLRNSVKYTATD